MVWVVYKGRAIARKPVQSWSEQESAQPRSSLLNDAQVYVVGEGHVVNMVGMHILAMPLAAAFAVRIAWHVRAQVGTCVAL